MRLYFLIICNFFLILTCSAQIKDTLFLWPDNVPGEIEPKHAPIQKENPAGNVIKLTDVTNPAMVVFEPNDSLNNGTGIIVCPGGGYGILAIDLEGYEVAEWLTKLGYTAFVLQYRVPRKREQALMDIQRAIRIVRNQANSRKLKDNKIGVLGFSAGGSLSARASTRYNEETYKQMDAIDTLSARPDFALLIYPAYLDHGKDRTLTPELAVDDNTPPMFIFGTADDKFGHSSLVMATALLKYKVPVELHFLPNGGHGYGIRPGNIAAETWPVLAHKWLNNHVLNRIQVSKSHAK